MDAVRIQAVDRVESLRIRGRKVLPRWLAILLVYLAARRRASPPSWAAPPAKAAIPPPSGAQPEPAAD